MKLSILQSKHGDSLLTLGKPIDTADLTMLYNHHLQDKIDGYVQFRNFTDEEVIVYPFDGYSLPMLDFAINYIQAIYYYVVNEDSLKEIEAQPAAQNSDIPTVDHDLRYFQTLNASELEGMPEQIHATFLVNATGIEADRQQINNMIKEGFIAYKHRSTRGTSYFDRVDNADNIKEGDHYEILYRTKQESISTPIRLLDADFQNKYAGQIGAVILLNKKTDRNILLEDITRYLSHGKAVWYKLTTDEHMYRFVNPRSIDPDYLKIVEKVVVIPPKVDVLNPTSDITKTKEKPDFTKRYPFGVPEGPDAQALWDMKLHESRMISNQTNVMRVPGGWLYATVHTNGKFEEDIITVTETFVPLNNEFI